MYMYYLKMIYIYILYILISDVSIIYIYIIADDHPWQAEPQA